MFERPLTKPQKKFFNKITQAISREIEANKNWISWMDAYAVLSSFNIRLVYTMKAKRKKK